MKAPDKIVIFPDDYPTLWYMPDGWETVPSGNVEYIRKDALLEWANNWLSFERSGIGLDEGFAHAMKIMIDKLDSM